MDAQNGGVYIAEIRLGPKENKVRNTAEDGLQG